MLADFDRGIHGAGKPPTVSRIQYYEEVTDMPAFSETHAKLCPLLVAGNLANPDRAIQFEARERHSTSCLEEDCAWWSEDGCAGLPSPRAMRRSPRMSASRPRSRTSQ